MLYFYYVLLLILKNIDHIFFTFIITFGKLIVQNVIKLIFIYECNNILHLDAAQCIITFIDDDSGNDIGYKQLAKNF